MLNNKIMSKLIFIIVGSIFLFGFSVPKFIPIIEPVDKVIGGAANLIRNFDIEDSPYYKKIDIYESNPTTTLIKLSNFKTYQQTSEYSCGASCVIMALDYFGIHNVSENQLVKEMDIRSYENKRDDGSFGATTESIVKALEARGLKVDSSLDMANADGYSFNSPEQFSEFVKKSLNNDQIIISENVEWGGHWMVIVGYDDMGTESLMDDVLIFADPYDTTNHNQNGYICKSFLRYFYEWFDAKVLPKEQSIQQFVRVSKVNK